MTTKQLYRIKTLAQELELGQSTIWKLVAEGKFPSGTKVSKKVRVWTHDEVQDWIERTTKGTVNEQ